MANSFRRLLSAFFVGVMLVLFLVPPGTAHAGGPALELKLGEATRGATRIPLVARLTDDAGAPVAAARITFLVNGTRDGEARTGVTGAATWRIRRDLPAGAYLVEAFWNQAPAIRATYGLVIAAPAIDLQLASEPKQIGERVMMKARLSMPDGAPVVDVPVAFEVDGQREAAVRTGASGEAEWTVHASLGTGNHSIKAVFDGQLPLLPSSKEHTFTLNSAELQVRTVPAWPGARFALNGREFVAGDDGIARVTVDHAGAYSLTVAGTGQEVAGMRREFATWGDGNTQAARTIDVPPGGSLDAGFNSFYLVTPRFTWANEQPVQPQRISSLTLANSVGRKLTVNPLQPLWLQGSYIADGAGHLEERAISYVVDSVIVDSSNVVNQSQHRIQPGADQTIDVGLFLFTAHFAARDALFGYPIATAIELTYPDGRTEEHALDGDGRATISPLARGLYRVKVRGSGLRFAQPLALSRDQEVTAKFISTLDLAVVFGAFAVVALGLLFLGRRSSILAWARGERTAAALSFQPGAGFEPVPAEPDDFSTMVLSEE